MKKLKGIAFAAWLIILALTAVFGHVFTDYAEKKFWWVAWDWAAWISALLFVLSIIWYTRKKKNW